MNGPFIYGRGDGFAGQLHGTGYKDGFGCSLGNGYGDGNGWGHGASIYGSGNGGGNSGIGGAYYRADDCPEGGRGQGYGWGKCGPTFGCPGT